MLLPRLTLPLVLSCALLPAAFGAVEVKDEDGKVRVTIDGQLFTEYCYTGAPHVYFYPIIGPGGARMTRDWPMQDTPGEEHDHPHHRSLWFAHGAVNGVDFWSEPASWLGKPPKTPLGQILHEKFLKLKGGEQEGVIKSVNRWQAPDGVPLSSIQTFRVYERPANERVFDFEVTLSAGEKEVVMGDTKEGTMAMRLAESMRLAGPKKQPGQGHLLSSEGVTDGEVWGKHATWVDYSGPVAGKTLGVAIFDHPQNAHHPTRWHARDYGLFAANPFCEHDMDKAQPAGAGDTKIPAGQSITLRYRFFIHEGDAAAAKVAEQYATYVHDSH